MSQEILKKRSELLEEILKDGMEKSLIEIHLLRNKDKMVGVVEGINLYKINYKYFSQLSKEAKYEFKELKEKYKEIIKKYKLE
ncbi:hypothetical protein COU58_03355 [Candidatus Pacearchaeota archaeon CG10_big_fil_rev_8_21_14_0_10_32_42]|nr:MAG: hypothetical protein COU58_03355 [Candidatus Pacearchaeota archaeon CG10_big_fil_rev_8_21_14_0_10_32_42]